MKIIILSSSFMTNLPMTNVRIKNNSFSLILDKVKFPATVNDVNRCKLETKALSRNSVIQSTFPGSITTIPINPHHSTYIWPEYRRRPLVGELCLPPKNESIKQVLSQQKYSINMHMRRTKKTHAGNFSKKKHRPLPTTWCFSSLPVRI